MRDMVCTSTSSIILAPSMGDPGTALTRQVHSCSQEDPIPSQTLPSRGDEFQSQRQNPSAYSVKNASLVRHYTQAFPRLFSVQPQVGP